MGFGIEYQKKSDSISTIIMILHIPIRLYTRKEKKVGFII
jgi:hypothetical protein